MLFATHEPTSRKNTQKIDDEWLNADVDRGNRLSNKWKHLENKEERQTLLVLSMFIRFAFLMYSPLLSIYIISAIHSGTPALF